MGEEEGPAPILYESDRPAGLASQLKRRARVERGAPARDAGRGRGRLNWSRLGIWTAGLVFCLATWLGIALAALAVVR